MTHHLATNIIDSVGQKLAANSTATFSASADFEVALQQLTPAYPGVVWVDPWPESNHSTFAMRGVPAVAFSSTGRIELAHWPDDDLRWLDPARVADIVRLIHEILALFGKEPRLLDPPKKPILGFPDNFPQE